MGESRGLMKFVFGVLFCILTLWCWCPIGYGSYGEVPRIMGMPNWAAILLLVGAVMFVVEWVYLFKTDLALYDDDLAVIMEQLNDLEKTKIESNQEG